jgi:hypothetical protein
MPPSERQLDLLRQVAAGTHSFPPEGHDSDEARERFQPEASDLISLGRQGFLEGVEQIKDYTGSGLIDCVSVKGLTGKGRRALAVE